MNNQQALDKVWKYFIIQHHKFGWDDKIDGCTYRSPVGSRCAIGCLLPKNLIGLAESVVGDIDVLLNEQPDIGVFFEGCDFSFLADLQNDHDISAASSNYEMFARDLKLLAEKWGLSKENLTDG